MLYSYLPWDSTKGEKEEVVRIVAVPPSSTNFPHPLLCPVRHLDVLHCRMVPGKRDTNPLQF